MGAGVKLNCWLPARAGVAPPGHANRRGRKTACFRKDLGRSCELPLNPSRAAGARLAGFPRILAPWPGPIYCLSSDDRTCPKDSLLSPVAATLLLFTLLYQWRAPGTRGLSPVRLWRTTPWFRASKLWALSVRTGVDAVELNLTILGAHANPRSLAELRSGFRPSIALRTDSAGSPPQHAGLKPGAARAPGAPSSRSPRPPRRIEGAHARKTA